LYPAVSPNKSIEGSAGGLVASLLGAGLCNWLIFPALGPWDPLGVGLFVTVVVPGNLLGQTGDLVESIIKRAHDVDDSGSIIYGHGGILDRIDGLIFAAPWFYICFVHLLPLFRS
jgi:phosphatidate cytidylyltransferase